MRYLSCARALLTRSLPLYVHYGVTHRCNLNCRMCGLWKIGRQETELTLPQIQQMAKNLHQLGTAAISLGGGEPFLRSDLPEIIQAFMDNGLEVRLLTNGLVKNQQLIERVCATGLRHISISLDTLDSAVQDDICSRPGAWNEIIEAIKMWSEILRPRRGLGVLNCVVSELNFRNIIRLLQVADAYGFYLSLVPIELHSYQEKDLGCRDSFSDMPFKAEDYEELTQLFQKLIAMKRSGHSRLFNSSSYLRGCLSYLKGEKPRNFHCRAGAISFSVSPEGYYSMCHYHSGLGQGANSAGTDSAGTGSAGADSASTSSAGAVSACTSSTGSASSPRISAASPDFVSWYKKSHAAALTSLTARQCHRCFRPCWQEINLALTDPSSFWEALFMQAPLPMPADLPSPQQLRTRLGLDTPKPN